MRPPASSDRLAPVTHKAVAGLLPRANQHTSSRQNACKRVCRERFATASAQKEAPDWDAERLVLRKRTLKPNQLETLRKFEEEVAIGTVCQLLWHCSVRLLSGFCGQRGRLLLLPNSSTTGLTFAWLCNHGYRCSTARTVWHLWRV